MKENNHINHETLKTMQDEVATLKQTYKSYKEKLTWVEDTFEEGIIEEKMDHYATKIRALNQKIATTIQEKQKLA